jgi:hypothetical protein
MHSAACRRRSKPFGHVSSPLPGACRCFRVLLTSTGLCPSDSSCLSGERPTHTTLTCWGSLNHQHSFHLFCHTTQANDGCSQTCRSNVDRLPPFPPTQLPSRTKTFCTSCTQRGQRKHTAWEYMLRRHLERTFWRRDHRSEQSGVTHHSDLRRPNLRLCLRCRCTIRRNTEACQPCRR